MFGAYDSNTAATVTLDIPREYEFDVNTGLIVVRNGSINIVEGLEAIKTWIYKCLMTQRNRYDAYTSNYGQEYEELIGSGLSQDAISSEAKRMTEEALKVNPHISSITNFTVSFFDNVMQLDFIAVTDYGNIKIHI